MLSSKTWGKWTFTSGFDGCLMKPALFSCKSWSYFSPQSSPEQRLWQVIKILVSLWKHFLSCDQERFSAPSPSADLTNQPHLKIQLFFLEVHRKYLIGNDFPSWIVHPWFNWGAEGDEVEFSLPGEGQALINPQIVEAGTDPRASLCQHADGHWIFVFCTCPSRFYGTENIWIMQFLISSFMEIFMLG